MSTGLLKLELPRPALRQKNDTPIPECVNCAQEGLMQSFFNPHLFLMYSLRY